MPDYVRESEIVEGSGDDVGPVEEDEETTDGGQQVARLAVVRRVRPWTTLMPLPNTNTTYGMDYSRTGLETNSIIFVHFFVHFWLFFSESFCRNSHYTVEYSLFSEEQSFSQKSSHQFL